MKFSILQSQLVPSLQLVSGEVEKRQTLPVLANLLIKVENAILSITATDLEIEMSVELTLDNPSQDGDITVPARKLVDICRSLSSDSLIEFQLVDSRLKIQTGKNRFSLSTISAQEFPNIEDARFDESLTISSQSLKDLIDKTQFAMAQQDVRYYLNGMLFEFEDNKLLTVATDGHRLALSRLQLDGQSVANKMQAIVPRKGVMEATKLLSSSDSQCQIKLNNNHLRIILDKYIFTSKLVDGRFPDYDKVLPKQAKRELISDRETIKDAFSRASILCNEKFRGVRLNISNSKLVIHANNPEQEEAEIELDIDYNSEDMEIGFNVGYLVDALNAIKTEKVRFNLGDSNSSVLIESDENADSLYVVMPMRL